jgi:hypothetical protein
VDIKTLKDLEKVVRLCRKLGVEAFECGNIKFNLGPAPKAKAKRYNVAADIPEAALKIPQFTPAETETQTDNPIKTDELSEDELLFYSAVDATQEQQ